MRIRAGTSGYSYKEWKGAFYPADLKDREMLAWYARQLSTVEINNTFYRMPRESVVARWAADVPEDFVFVVKASQRITHHARLAGADEAVGYLWRTVAHLGERLGPLLFQLPPNFRKDLPRLEAFLASLPAGMRAAFEFRNASWEEEDVVVALRAAGAALCLADTDERPDPPLVATTDWGYLRLRRTEYDAAALGAWRDRVRALPWREAFVFFKHEDAGAGPRMAREFLDLCRRDA
jgi:uncharacterized protein YecE (DUF72 family)